MDLPLNTPQFFFEEDWIAQQQRVVRRWLPASVYPEPVLRPDRPWEGRSLVLYGSVFADSAGGYRMYYSNFRPGIGPSLLMLATSRDGFTWEKPELGLVEFEGSTSNNILLHPDRPTDSPSVLFDQEDSEFPWKLSCFHNDPPPPMWGTGWGMAIYRSRDGLRWERLPIPPVRIGDRSSFFRDARSGRYVLLSRDPDMFAFAGGRHISRCQSEDLTRWSAPELILARDLHDEPAVELYGMPVFHRNGWDIGLLEHWDSSHDIIEIHLALSRDGRRWMRPLPRRPFIAASFPWNRAWSTAANTGPLIINEQMVFYFGGRWVAHTWDSARHHGVIGFASLPIDRFCALEGAAGGTFITPAFTWPGGELVLNADTRESFESHPGHCDGEIAVEVLDGDGRPLPEWSGENKALFRGNTHCRGGIHGGSVHWPGERRLEGLKGSTLALRFTLRHARLFTFMAQSL